MESIQIFNCVVDEVLHQCYESFPAAAKIFPNKITIKVAKHFDEIAEMEEAFEFSKEIYLNCIDTIAWLEREGFLYFEKRESDYFKAVIKLKGLNAINKVPEKFKDI